MNKISVHICTRDRPTEIALLLQSLRTQTYKNYNVIILDDGGGTPLTNYYFLVYLINRMKLEGHDIKMIRNNNPSGVSKARQQLIDFSLKHGKEEYFCRVDDDSILDENYLMKLVEVINKGYDVATGMVPHLSGQDNVRDIKSVEPIIGYCELNNVGELEVNFDDCANFYTEEQIIPSPHFRSCALFKREIFEKGISYESRLSKNGFREEQVLSWKIITSGYKIGCHTGAIAYHLVTPSGGERDTMNMCQFNQEQFDIFTKRLFEEKGDFLKEYYNRLNVVPKKITDLEKLKSNNLVYKKKEVNLLHES